VWESWKDVPWQALSWSQLPTTAASQKFTYHSPSDGAIATNPSLLHPEFRSLPISIQMMVNSAHEQWSKPEISSLYIYIFIYLFI
jgi:hypothetical protein